MKIIRNSISLAIVFVAIIGFSFATEINWNGNDWAEGCDFEGNDLANEKTIAEKCGETCEKTPDCTHFTWTDYNGGTCWMKKNSATKDDAKYNGDKNIVCGIVSQISGAVNSKHDDVEPVINWNGKNWAVACDFEGNDLANEKTTSDQCEKTCEKRRGCTHFSWTGYNGGTCWMKKNPVTKDDAKYNGNKGMICGVSLKVNHDSQDTNDSETKTEEKKPDKISKTKDIIDTGYDVLMKLLNISKAVIGIVKETRSSRTDDVN